MIDNLVSSLREWRTSERPNPQAAAHLHAWLHERTGRTLRNQIGHHVSIPPRKREDIAQSVLAKLWARRLDIPPDDLLDRGNEGESSRYLETMLANTYLSDARKKTEAPEGEADQERGTAPAQTETVSVDASHQELKLLIHELLPVALMNRRPQDRPKLEAAAKDCVEMLEQGGGVPALLRRQGEISDATPETEQKTKRNKIYQQQHRLRDALRSVAETRTEDGTLSGDAFALLDRIVPQVETSCQPTATRRVSSGGPR